MAFGARVQLVGKRGRREMPLEEFIRGNRVTALGQDEFLENVLLDEPLSHSASRYLFMGLREAMEIDMVSVAVNMALNPEDGKVSHIGIVMGAVAPTPLRARKAEEILLGKIPDDNLLQEAADSCAAESRPIDDFRASAAYRREMVRVLSRRGLQETLNVINDHQ
jgi:carbon-monoxide dehydrogenase medium subunit